LACSLYQKSKIEDGFLLLRELMQMFTKLVLPVLILLAVLGIWEAGVYIRNTPHFILPPPSEIVVTLFVKRELLLKHSFVTLQEMVLGFALAISIGVPLAILMFEFPILEKAFYPYVIGSQTVPVFAIAPLLVVWFGFGIASKVVMAAIIVFFAIVLNTLDGLKSADPDTVNLFRILRATRWQILWKVRIPSALPFIFSGAKIGISISTIGAVIGEWIGASAGLGYLMLYANAQLQISLMFAAIFCLTLLGLSLFALMTLLERFAMPWRRHQRNISDVR
jgi:ABC-type nitrate/sulfonate/bicarbonate transport system permease component